MSFCTIGTYLFGFSRRKQRTQPVQEGMGEKSDFIKSDPFYAENNIPVTTYKCHRNQWELKVKKSQLPQALENGSGWVAIGFGFTSDWLKRWQVFFFPTNHRAKANSMQHRCTYRYSIESHSIGFTRSPLNQEPYSNITDLLFRLNSTSNAMFIIPAGNVNFKLTVDRVLILWWQKS